MMRDVEFFRLCACVLTFMAALQTSNGQIGCSIILTVPSGQGTIEISFNSTTLPVTMKLTLICNVGYVTMTTLGQKHSYTCTSSRRWDYRPNDHINCILPPAVYKQCPFTHTFSTTKPFQAGCTGGCNPGSACCGLPRTASSSCAIISPRPLPKPGVCTYPENIGNLCMSNCVHDFECSGTQKCCHYLHGGTTCPASLGARGCTDRKVTGCMISNCPLGQTCNLLPDRQPECLNAQCPAYTIQGCPSGSVDTCISDLNCNFNGLCCFDGCRKTCKATTCPKINILNAYLSSVNVAIGSQVQIQCLNTFSGLDGKSRWDVTCTVNGGVSTWFPALPSCITKLCVPLTIPNGRIDSQITYNGAFVRVFCFTQYESVGGITNVTCLHGTWSANPVCKQTPKCPTLIIQNGVAQSQDTRLNTLVEVRCVNNYRLQNSQNKYARCIRYIATQAPRWLLPLPICVPPTCVLPAKPDHGDVNPQIGNNNNIGSIVIYTCDRGYRLEPRQGMGFCKANGLYEPSPPRCLRIQCEPMGTPLNGRKSVEGRIEVNQQVRFSCIQGYRTLGAEVLTCLAHGAYDNPAPTCIRAVTCQDLRSVYPRIDRYPSKDPRIPNDQNPVLSYVYFTCSGQSHTLIGVNRLQCLHTGAWSGPVPSCRVEQCRDPPPSIQNGRYTTTNNNVIGSQAQYTCNAPEFTFTGDRLLKCEGQPPRWQGRVPQCAVRDCGNLPNLANAEHWHQHLSVTIGSVHSVSCNRNYQPSRITASCSPLVRWEYSSECTAIKCREVQRPHNGGASGSNNLLGSTVRITCNSGYQITSTDLLTCQNTRDGYQYVPAVPNCLPITCTNLPVPRDGTLQFPTEAVPGTVARFGCNIGYLIEGQSDTKCKDNGQWDNMQTPACRLVQCGNSLPNIPNAITNVPSVGDPTYGKTLSVKCDNGYMPEAISVICNSDAKWVPRQSCMARPLCPNIIINGDVKLTMERDLLTVDFSCDSGYVLVGNNRSKCEGGRWNPEQNRPICRPLSCQLHNIVTNGPLTYATNGLNGAPGTVYTFACRQGYQLVGRNTVRCLANRLFSDPLPTCRIEEPQCGDQFRHPANGQVIYSNSDQQTRRADFRCNVGFQPPRPSVSYCNRGVWVPNFAPNCVRAVVQLQCRDQFSHPANGQVIYHNRADTDRETSRAEFRCSAGFQLTGPSISHCNRGVWQPNYAPTCVRVATEPCRQDLSLQYGAVRYERIQDGVRAHFTCDSNYRLSPQTLHTLDCSNGRPWTNLPRCEAGPQGPTCSQLPPLGNGHIDYTNNGAEGSIVTLICNNGFSLRNPANPQRPIICRNGRWDNSQNECVSSQTAGCLSNWRVRYAGITFFELLGDLSAYVYCDAGYTIRGSANLRCLNGQWDNSIPTCEPTRPAVCPRNWEVRNGDRTFLEISGEVSVVVVCHNGYTIRGSANLRCLNGQWDNSIPTCEPTRPRPCNALAATRAEVTYTITGRPVSPTNGRVTSGTTALVRCVNRGEAVRGSPNFQCNDGRWDPNQGEIICQAPPAGPMCPAINLAGVRYSDNQRRTGSYAYFACNGVAEVQVQCRNGGAWHPHPVSCGGGTLAVPQCQDFTSIHASTIQYYTPDNEARQIRIRCTLGQTFYGTCKALGSQNRFVDAAGNILTDPCSLSRIGT